MPLALKQVEILPRCKERQTLLRVLSCMWPRNAVPFPSECTLFRFSSSKETIAVRRLDGAQWELQPLAPAACGWGGDDSSADDRLTTSMPFREVTFLACRARCT